MILTRTVLTLLLCLIVNLSLQAQSASLNPISPGMQEVGTEYSVEVHVGDPVAVSDLFGISFQLVSGSTTTEFVGGSAEEGDFLGADVITFAESPDAQTVDFAVTRKSGSGGVDGSGIVMVAKFVSSEAGPVKFSLEGVEAVDPNGEAIPIELSDLTVDVTASPEPNLNLSPSDLNFESSADSKTFGVISNLDSWTATSDADWITISDASGSGDDPEVIVSVTENMEDVSRSGIITVEGETLSKTIQVVQDAPVVPTEDASVSVTSTGPHEVGTAYTVEVQVGDPDAVSDLFGISFQLVAGSSMTEYVSGSATEGDFLGSDVIAFPETPNAQTVDFAVTRKSGAGGVNGSGIVMSAEFVSSQAGPVTFSLEGVEAVDPSGVAIPMELSDLTITVDPTPNLEVSLTDLNFESSASSKTFGVTSNLDSWTATSDADWITIRDASGSGDDSEVSVSVTENMEDVSRSGEIIVEGGELIRTITVKQEATNKPGVVKLESPADGDKGVDRDLTLRWQAEETANRYRVDVSTDASHNNRIIRKSDIFSVSFSPEDLAEGTTYYWRVQAFNEETGYGEWSDTWSFTTQVPIEWELSPQNVELADASASSFEFSIDQTGGTDDLTWSVSTDAGWLTPDGNDSGTGDATVSYLVEANESTAGREASILVSTNAGDKTVSVTQPPPGQVSLDFGGPISGQAGDGFTIEVETSDLTDLGVSNFDVEFSYDTSLLDIVEENIEAGGLLGGPVTVNVTDDGRILVSYASSQDLEGSGILFTVSGSLAGEGQNPEGLRVIDLLIGDGSLEVSPTLPLDIAVDIIVNTPPSVSIDNGPPNDGSIDFDDPGFVWSGSDSDGTVDGYEVELLGPSSNGFSTTETSFQFENLANGNYTFRVRAIDNNGAYSEWSERSFTVNDLEDFPDLLVEDVNGPGKAEIGSEIDVTFRILNNGQLEATAGWTGRIYLSNDTSITDEDTEIGSWQQDDIIASGGDESVTKQGVIPESYAIGEYYLGVIVDVESELTEETDENNVAVSSSKIEIGEITSNTKDGRVLTFNLEQNYPNPFNPSTQIQYSLPEQAHVTLEIYTMLGERVGLLVNEVKSPGIHEVAFDASNFSSGVYLYRLQTDSYLETRQMMLIK